MKVTLAYPYNGKSPDSTVDLDETEARALLRAGRARPVSESRAAAKPAAKKAATPKTSASKAAEKKPAPAADTGTK